MPSNDLGPPWKTIEIIYSPRATNTPSVKFQYLSLLEISCLKSFITLISNDLKWPPWKTIGIFYSWRTTYIPSLIVKQHLVLKIPCLQGFTRFSDFDLWWPHMTIDLHENNTNCLLTKCYLHTKFKVQTSFASWDIVFTTFSYFDLWWPQMTFDLHEKQ